ncbi:hypothetical protein PUN28_020174 [Cardiocondyla obscurior]|uniref:Uncharacterized protein n=1 Tax=Cardiocondyla obscurior TaxID=286306 RepID=A0AAW2EB56_9HYME
MNSGFELLTRFSRLANGRSRPGDIISKPVPFIRYFRYTILRLRNVKSHKMQTMRYVARKRSHRKMSLVTVGTHIELKEYERRDEFKNNFYYLANGNALKCITLVNFPRSSKKCKEIFIGSIDTDMHRAYLRIPSVYAIGSMIDRPEAERTTHGGGSIDIQSLPAVSNIYGGVYLQ